MSESLLVRMIGWPATLVHGDTYILDRWLWASSLLPETRNGEKLIDIGCGSGAFTIGAARRGYESTGVSHNRHDLEKARERAEICNVENVDFQVIDIRNLHERHEYEGRFDTAICFEVIEHILDDEKLMNDMARCLKPGGRLLLTTPNFLYRHTRPEELGPFPEVEDGGHVRRGYTKHMLEDLCKASGLVPEVSFCTGFLSQKISKYFRAISKVNHIVGWMVTAPLRVIPPIFDKLVTNLSGYPYYCICVEAYKPRYGLSVDTPPSKTSQARNDAPTSDSYQ